MFIEISSNLNLQTNTKITSNYHEIFFSFPLRLIYHINLTLKILPYLFNGLWYCRNEGNFNFFFFVIYHIFFVYLQKTCYYLTVFWFEDSEESINYSRDLKFSILYCPMVYVLKITINYSH